MILIYVPQKGAIVEEKEQIPTKGHELEKLARESGLDFPVGLAEDLAEITRHFWRVRYSDFRRADYGSRAKVLQVYKKTEEVHKWIIQKLSENN